MHTLIRIDTIDASDISVFPKDKLSAIEVRVRAHSKLIRRTYHCVRSRGILSRKQRRRAINRQMVPDAAPRFYLSIIDRSSAIEEQ